MAPKPSYAQIILEKTSSFTDRAFEYRIPAELAGKLEIGQTVIIPFGKRKTTGYVLGFTSQIDIPAEKIKELIEIVNPVPVFDQASVDLARFVSEYYLCFFGAALKLMIRKAPKKIAPKTEPPKADALKIKSGPQLNAEQEAALQAIFEASGDDNGRAANKPILLFGVTGSGKTEVYLQAIARVLKEGKNVLVLVPEIGLTSFLEERFQERFSDHLVVLHSGLKESEIKKNWEKILSGQARIVLGTRMALFSPLRKLGLIILDEEYEITYKSDRSPRYHARTIAEWLSKYHQAPLVMGTATPSMESYQAVQAKQYQLALLTKPINPTTRPMIEVVDLKKENKEGNYSLLSRPLRKAIEEALKNKEQVLLFLNRRGYSTSAVCGDCQEIVQCPNCSVALAYFLQSKELVCPKCTFRSTSEVACSKCLSSNIKFHGAGTQKLELEVKANYPKARVVRFDVDSSSATDLAGNSALEQFAKGEADILIGTQLVTKGLNLPNLTLAGIINPDQALTMPDFRASEHVFQQLTQIIGRVGRGKKAGKVILQTRDHENQVIQSLIKGETKTFYQTELENRKAVNFPPFSSLVNIIVAGSSEQKTAQLAQTLKALLGKSLPSSAIMGGSWAPVKKVRGKFRQQIILKGNDLNLFREAIKRAISELGRDLAIIVDVDPMFLF